MLIYKGIISARIVEVRFAIAGKINFIGKRKEDKVLKNELIASLDKKSTQIELDRELADFEKKRAEFDLFNLKNKDDSDVVKFERTYHQAQLTASIKNVELAKSRLDATSLYSPVEGYIVNDSFIEVGINCTPASATIQICDTSTYCFVFTIPQEKVLFFKNTKEATIQIDGMKDEVIGKTKAPFSDGKLLYISIPISDTANIYLGQHGKAKIKNTS